jgi:hypothetical protein
MLIAAFRVFCFNKLLLCGIPAVTARQWEMKRRQTEIFLLFITFSLQLLIGSFKTKTHTMKKKMLLFSAFTLFAFLQEMHKADLHEKP